MKNIIHPVEGKFHMKNYFKNICSKFYTRILEANLFAFAYRLFHEDFSSIAGVLHDTQPFSSFIYTKFYNSACGVIFSQ